MQGFQNAQAYFATVVNYERKMFMKLSPVGAFFVGFSAEKREGP
jgi:hypothetical protein